MGKFISHYDHLTGLVIWTTSVSGIGSYYYKCPRAPEGFGPFDTQTAALKHYNSLVKTTVIHVVPPPVPRNNVITVDFVMKKRVG